MILLLVTVTLINDTNTAVTTVETAITKRMRIILLI